MRLRIRRALLYAFGAIILTSPFSCGAFAYWQYQLGQREYDAHQQLCAMGATGDDWVGLRELLNPKFRPIEQIKLPPELAVHAALPYLQHLDHLTSLEVSSTSFSPEDFESLQHLKWFRWLELAGSCLNDGHIPQLANLRGRNHLNLYDTSITDEGLRELKKSIPSCRMWRDGKEVGVQVAMTP
jgi:hypothetical protein